MRVRSIFCNGVALKRGTWGDWWFAQDGTVRFVDPPPREGDRIRVFFEDGTEAILSYHAGFNDEILCMTVHGQ